MFRDGVTWRVGVLLGRGRPRNHLDLARVPIQPKAKVLCPFPRKPGYPAPRGAAKKDRPKDRPFGSEAFIFETVPFLIHPVKNVSTDKETQEDEEPGAVFGEINQVVAKPHFHDNRGDFSDESGFQVFLTGQFTQYRNGGEKNIWRIGDSPGQSHILCAAVLVQFCEHMFLLDNGTGLFPEENTADVETDFNADDFPNPGDDDARDQPEQGTVHRKEGNGRYAENIAENEKAYAHQKSTISEGGNIVCQPVHIASHGEMDGVIVEFRVVGTYKINGYDGSNDKDQKANDLFAFVNHIVSFSPSPGNEGILPEWNGASGRFIFKMKGKGMSPGKGRSLFRGMPVLSGGCR